MTDQPYSFDADPGGHTDPTTAQMYVTIIDPSGFFRASSEIDVVRDTAQTLLGANSTPAATRMLADAYSRARTDAATALQPEAGTALLTRCPELGPTVDLAEVVVATALLARVCDTHLNLPGFLVSLAANSSQLAAIKGGDVGSFDGAPPAHGSYL